MSNKKINIGLPLLFSIAVIIGMFVGYKLHSNMPNAKSIFSSGGKNKMGEVLELVRQRYVDEVNVDSVSEIGIEKVLSSLDPHSVYIPISSLKEINEDLEGQFEGIGVEFNIIKDSVHILAVLPNGPAFNAGLKIGDRIIAVNDSTAIGIKDTEQFKKWVKGPSGTEVTLKIQRDKNIIVKKIARGTIPLKSVDASYMLDANTGYIRLNRFSGTTYEEFMKSLESLKNQGMKSMILDLRDNGGGILEEAVDIADEFIGDNKLIVYTQGKNNPRKEYLCKRPGLFEEGKVAILMNEGSASASEVLAGALQDLDRATIIGRRSFGKGLVQEQYTLSDGSALRLTTARYYTPLGRSIQKSYQNGSDEYNMEIVNRLHNQTQEEKDTAAIQHGKKYKTASGKLLYGGGGITPDYFIAIDSALFDTSLNRLYAKNTLSNFAYNYYMTNKTALANYKNSNDFNNQFALPQNYLSLLMDFVKKDDITLSIKNENSKQFLGNRIKAMIARILFGETGYFQVLNRVDPSMKKGLESIR